MKKKLLLTFVLAIVFALTLTVAIFADSIHNENTVDYSEKVTLGDGTVLPLFDENKEALIWYISGQDGEGKNTYASIRADDPQVIYYSETWCEVTSTRIDLSDGTKISSSNFVVINWMDDDVLINECKEAKHIGKPVTGFKLMFEGNKNLEYIYLRHDTTNIQRQNFNGCPKLKYINFEDLTKLKRIGDGQNFSNCSLLFKGQVIDLSNTVLTTIDNGGSFNNVHFTKIIFPSTLTSISDWTFQATSVKSFAWPTTVKSMNASMFKNNTGLEEIYLSNTLTSIGKDAFLNVNTLEKIFFVGSKDEFITLLASVNATGNNPFFNVVGENNANLISYADYKALEDKSGKYVVYNYSYCEAYADGVHTPVTLTNNCVGVCDTCGDTVINHTEIKNISVKIEYADFMKAGTKTITCQNEGCTYIAKEETKALFACSGYSTPENGKGGIVIGYTINSDAIAEYQSITGKSLKYGAFAVAKERLGVNDIFDKDGNKLSSAIVAEIAGSYASFELKITGFNTDEHKTVKIAMGAYVSVTNGDTTEYSYLQYGTPLENESYCFISYNDIVGSNKETEAA